MRLVAVALVMAFSFPASAASICIDGDNLFSGDVRQIEIYDEVCGVNLGRFQMVGGQKTAGPSNLCLSSAGFITLQHRNITNNGPWIRVSWLKDGECFKP